MYDRGSSETWTEASSSGSAFSFARNFLYGGISAQGHHHRSLNAVLGALVDACEEGQFAVAGDVGAAEIQEFDGMALGGTIADSRDTTQLTVLIAEHHILAAGLRGKKRNDPIGTRDRIGIDFELRPTVIGDGRAVEHTHDA